MTDSKAMEAAARAIWAEMPLERGIGPTTASEIFAQAAITAYLAQREADGFVMVPVGIIDDLCRELEAEVKDRWGYDERLAHKIERDMQTVNKARAMIAARPKG